MYSFNFNFDQFIDIAWKMTYHIMTKLVMMQQQTLQVGPFPLYSAWPRILYTCSAQDEPDHEIALHALDLAHRWQVEAVVEILTDLLAGAYDVF